MEKTSDINIQSNHTSIEGKLSSVSSLITVLAKPDQQLLQNMLSYNILGSTESTNEGFFEVQFNFSDHTYNSYIHKDSIEHDLMHMLATYIFELDDLSIHSGYVELLVNCLQSQINPLHYTELQKNFGVDSKKAYTVLTQHFNDDEMCTYIALMCKYFSPKEVIQYIKIYYQLKTVIELIPDSTYKHLKIEIRSALNVISSQINNNSFPITIEPLDIPYITLHPSIKNRIKAVKGKTNQNNKPD